VTVSGAGLAGRLRPDAGRPLRGVLALYSGRVARRQVPDDVLFLDDIPLGPTGKVLNNKLRELCKDCITLAETWLMESQPEFWLAKRRYRPTVQ